MEGVPLDVDRLDLAVLRTGVVNGPCTKFTYFESSVIVMVDFIILFLSF